MKLVNGGVRGLVCALVFLGCAATARAQDAPAGEFSAGWRLLNIPDTFGFGDSQTLVSINGDFRYRFQVKSQWVPYVGAGLAVHFFSFDNPGPGVDSSDTRAGGHIIGGAQVLTKNKSTFFAELKLGLGDSPDFKAMAGWSFKI